MQSKEQDNLIFIRLFPGDSIFDCLRDVCDKYKVKTAVALSGLGQLGSFALGFFKEKGDYAEEDFYEPHELLMLTGNISRQEGEYDFHLHAVLGDAQKRVIGGHFIKGVVSITGEIVLLKTDLEVRREEEKETGLRGLFLD